VDVQRDPLCSQHITVRDAYGHIGNSSGRNRDFEHSVGTRPVGNSERAFVGKFLGYLIRQRRADGRLPESGIILDERNADGMNVRWNARPGEGVAAYQAGYRV